MVACGTLTVSLHLHSLAEVIHAGVGLLVMQLFLSGVGGQLPVAPQRKDSWPVGHRARLGRVCDFGLSIGGLT